MAHPPVTVHLSQPATRRKQFHYVFNHAGENIYTTRDSGELFEWLAHFGPDEVRLRCRDEYFTFRWVDRPPPW